VAGQLKTLETTDMGDCARRGHLFNESERTGSSREPIGFRRWLRRR